MRVWEWYLSFTNWKDSELLVIVRRGTKEHREAGSEGVSAPFELGFFGQITSSLSGLQFPHLYREEMEPTCSKSFLTFDICSLWSWRTDISLEKTWGRGWILRSWRAPPAFHPKRANLVPGEWWVHFLAGSLGLLTNVSMSTMLHLDSAFERAKQESSNVCHIFVGSCPFVVNLNAGKVESALEPNKNFKRSWKMPTSSGQWHNQCPWPGTSWRLAGATRNRFVKRSELLTVKSQTGRAITVLVSTWLAIRINISLQSQ